MIRLLHGTISRLMYAAVWVLVLFAILLSALRMALPLTDHLRNQVVATLSHGLGHPVQVEAMSVRLVGWTPRLRLDELVVADPVDGSDVIRLDALELDLDLPETVRTGAPQLRALTLVGAHLTVRRLVDGRVQLDGLTALQSDDPAALEAFLGRGSLNLLDSEIWVLDDGFSGPLPHLTEVRLRLHNDGRTHRLDLSARPVSPLIPSAADCPADAQLRMLAQLNGDGLDADTWSGTVYVNLAGADLSALVPPGLLKAGEAGSRSALIESWATVRHGGLSQVLSRVGVRGLKFHLPAQNHLGAGTDPPAVSGAAAASGSELVSIERMKGLARISRSGDGWLLGLRDLALSLSGTDLPDLDLNLRLSGEGRIEDLQMAAGQFDVGLVERLIPMVPRPLPAAVTGFLGRSPRGRLDRLGLTLARSPDGAIRWQFSALGFSLGIDQSGKNPGFDGLSGRLNVRQDGGELALASAGLRLDLAPLFDHPMVLDQLSGLIGWGWGPKGALRLSARNLVLENVDVAGRVRFLLELPAPGSEPDPGPWLDLRASFHDGNGANARPYLPVGVIHPDLVTWLSRALIDGRFTQADVVLRGPLKQYPFRAHEGRFELLAQFEDTVLDYLEGWPRIEAAVGNLHFLNQGMTITVESGRILGSTLSAGRAQIPDLWGARRMALHGEARGPLSDGLSILGETPLAEHLGPLAQALAVKGQMDLALDMSIPLHKEEPLKVDGRIGWPGGPEIALKETPLVLTDLDGTLKFTIDSLTADGIGANLWGHPVKLSVATQNPGDGVNAVTRISARGKLPVTDLAAHFTSSAWSLAQGAADLALEVELRNADLKSPNPPLGFRLSSDLRGLQLDIPSPLGKAVTQSRPLDLAGSLVPGRSMDVSGSFGDLGLNLALVLGDAGLELDRGRVRLGADSAPAADSAGLTLDGTLANVDLSVWSGWWGRVGPRLLMDSTPAALPGPAPATHWLTLADLRFNVLTLGAMDLNDIQVQVRPGAAAWDLRVESTQLAGRVSLPMSVDEAPLDIGLDRLDLSALLPEKSAGAFSAPPKEGLENPLPPIDVRIADLRWGDASLGRFRLEMRPDVSGGRVPLIEFDGPGDTQMTGEAQWSVGVDGRHARLALDLKSADTGPLLDALDYTAALGEASVEASVRLQWQGGLEDFDLARSEGPINLDVGPGRILAVEPGVGRVIGFLNLGALGRRLSLDFRDLYDEGFSFERMQGDIELANGRAELRRFDIEGLAGLVRVSGSTDLRAGTFNQIVTVEPKIGSSVALATALAGGPVAGAAVFLADKVSGGAIDKFAGYQYRVTGPWANPELTRLGWEPFADGEGSGPPGQPVLEPGGVDRDAGRRLGSPGDPQVPTSSTSQSAGAGHESPSENLFLD